MITEFLMGKRTLLAGTVGLCLFFSLCLDAGAQKKTAKKKKQAAAAADDLDSSAEPDKVLYDRAQNDLKHGRYTEGRLSLQTLINTYPDSEYLAKAKLSIADSYYKEGGASNLMQSIQEYKDFNTFFPFLDEAAYAQMQIGMAHYKMMEKADRDNAQAQMAEDELQAMLLKYPQSPLAAQATQRLREVQEVLADGDFRVARYYYNKGDTHAAGARLIELTERYPLYSQSDEALWMLGDIYTKTKLATKDEDLRNVWAGQAARCYDRIVHDYPLSKRAQEAKGRLKAMGAPVPSVDPDAMARMRKEQELAKEHHSTFGALLNSPKGMLHGAPDVSAAAHSGQPNLNPPTDTVSATEVLKAQSGGPKMDVGAASVSSGAESGPTTQVDATSGSSAGSSTEGMHAGVQIITPMENGNAAPAASTPSTSSTQAQPATDAHASATAAPDSATPNGTSGNSAAPSSPGSAAAPSAPAASAPQAGSSSQAAQSTPQGSSTSTPASAANAQPAAAQSSGDSDDSKESTSKKKKGLRKLVPW
jgi:outer membrane protein assembly factor BamD